MVGLTEASGSSLLLDDELASTTAGQGASLIGVEDSAGNFAGSNVESVLTELFSTVSGFLKAVVVKNASYTVLASNQNELLDVTGTSTITLLPAAAAGDGFAFAVRNSGAAVVTVDPDGTETVNGDVTLVLAAGDWAILVCDGSDWVALNYTPPASAAISGLARVGLDALLQYYGDSSNGAFNSVGASTLSESLYDYTTFALNVGHTLTIDVPFIIIRATVSIVIDGDINGTGSDISSGAGALLGRLGSSPGGGGGGGGGGGDGINNYADDTLASTVGYGQDGEQGESSYFVAGGLGGARGATATVGSDGLVTPTSGKDLIKVLFSKLLGRGAGAGGRGGRGGHGYSASSPAKVPGGTPGSGGLSGCLIVLIAPVITIGASTTVDVTGQAGANSAASGSGGGVSGSGGGGGGGTVVKVTPDLTDSGTTTVTGGLGGTSGADGGAGADGYVYTIDPTA